MALTEEEQKALDEKKQKEDDEAALKKKEEEELKQKEEDEEKSIKAIMADREVAEDLLYKKRAANAQAKEEREAKEALQRKLDEIEKKELERKGEFEKLAKNAEEELVKAKEKFKNAQIKSAIRFEAISQGLVDIDLVSLINTSEVTISDDFEIEGIEEAVKAFKKAKPSFFEESDDSKSGDRSSFSGGKPNLRSKVKGTQDGLSPVERMQAGLDAKGKKR